MIKTIRHGNFDPPFFVKNESIKKILLEKAENKPSYFCFLGQSGKPGDALMRLFQHFKRLYESRGSPDCGGRYVNVFRIDVACSCLDSGQGRFFIIKKCLGSNISRVVFPHLPSSNSLYIEHTFHFRKEEKKR